MTVDIGKTDPDLIRQYAEARGLFDFARDELRLAQNRLLEQAGFVLHEPGTKKHVDVVNKWWRSLKRLGRTTIPDRYLNKTAYVTPEGSVEFCRTYVWQGFYAKLQKSVFQEMLHRDVPPAPK